MRNSFINDITNMASWDLTTGEQESLTQLSCEELLKASFKEHTFLDFWIKQSSEYPMLSDKVVWTLLPFATTYL